MDEKNRPIVEVCYLQLCWFYSIDCIGEPQVPSDDPWETSDEYLEPEDNRSDDSSDMLCSPSFCVVRVTVWVSLSVQGGQQFPYKYNSMRQCLHKYCGCLCQHRTGSALQNPPCIETLPFIGLDDSVGLKWGYQGESSWKQMTQDSLKCHHQQWLSWYNFEGTSPRNRGCSWHTFEQGRTWAFPNVRLGGGKCENLHSTATTEDMLPLSLLSILIALVTFTTTYVFSGDLIWPLFN